MSQRDDRSSVSSGYESDSSLHSRTSDGQEIRDLGEGKYQAGTRELSEVSENVDRSTGKVLRPHEHEDDYVYGQEGPSNVGRAVAWWGRGFEAVGNRAQKIWTGVKSLVDVRRSVSAPWSPGLVKDPNFLKTALAFDPDLLINSSVVAPLERKRTEFKLRHGQYYGTGRSYHSSRESDLRPVVLDANGKPVRASDDVSIHKLAKQTGRPVVGVDGDGAVFLSAEKPTTDRLREADVRNEAHNLKYDAPKGVVVYECNDKGVPRMARVCWTRNRGANVREVKLLPSEVGEFVEELQNKGVDWEAHKNSPTKTVKAPFPSILSTVDADGKRNYTMMMDSLQALDRKAVLDRSKLLGQASAEQLLAKEGVEVTDKVRDFTKKLPTELVFDGFQSKPTKSSQIVLQPVFAAKSVTTDSGYLNIDKDSGDVGSGVKEDMSRERANQNEAQKTSKKLTFSSWLGRPNPVKNSRLAYTAERGAGSKSLQESGLFKNAFEKNLLPSEFDESLADDGVSGIKGGLNDPGRGVATSTKSNPAAPPKSSAPNPPPSRRAASPSRIPAPAASIASSVSSVPNARPVQPATPVRGAFPPPPPSVGGSSVSSLASTEVEDRLAGAPVDGDVIMDRESGVVFNVPHRRNGRNIEFDSFDGKARVTVPISSLRRGSDGNQLYTVNLSKLLANKSQSDIYQGGAGYHAVSALYARAAQSDLEQGNSPDADRAGVLESLGVDTLAIDQFLEGNLPSRNAPTRQTVRSERGNVPRSSVPASRSFVDQGGRSDRGSVTRHPAPLSSGGLDPGRFGPSSSYAPYDNNPLRRPAPDSGPRSFRDTRAPVYAGEFASGPQYRQNENMPSRASYERGGGPEVGRKGVSSRRYYDTRGPEMEDEGYGGDHDRQSRRGTESGRRLPSQGYYDDRVPEIADDRWHRGDRDHQSHYGRQESGRMGFPSNRYGEGESGSRVRSSRSYVGSGRDTRGDGPRGDTPGYLTDEQQNFADLVEQNKADLDDVVDSVVNGGDNKNANYMIRRKSDDCPALSREELDFCKGVAAVKSPSPAVAAAVLTSAKNPRRVDKSTQASIMYAAMAYDMKHGSETQRAKGVPSRTMKLLDAMPPNTVSKIDKVQEFLRTKVNSNTRSSLGLTEQGHAALELWRCGGIDKQQMADCISGAFDAIRNDAKAVEATRPIISKMQPDEVLDFVAALPPETLALMLEDGVCSAAIDRGIADGIAERGGFEDLEGSRRDVLESLSQAVDKNAAAAYENERDSQDASNISLRTLAAVGAYQNSFCGGVQEAVKDAVARCVPESFPVDDALFSSHVVDDSYSEEIAEKAQSKGEMMGSGRDQEVKNHRASTTRSAFSVF